MKKNLTRAHMSRIFSEVAFYTYLFVPTVFIFTCVFFNVLQIQIEFGLKAMVGGQAMQNFVIV